MKSKASANTESTDGYSWCEFDAHYKHDNV